MKHLPNRGILCSEQCQIKEQELENEGINHNRIVHDEGSEEHMPDATHRNCTNVTL